jgi:hypothetical protein
MPLLTIIDINPSQVLAGGNVVNSDWAWCRRRRLIGRFVMAFHGAVTDKFCGLAI